MAERNCQHLLRPVDDLTTIEVMKSNDALTDRHDR